MMIEQVFIFSIHFYPLTVINPHCNVSQTLCSVCIKTLSQPQFLINISSVTLSLVHYAPQKLISCIIWSLSMFRYGKYILEKHIPCLLGFIMLGVILLFSGNLKLLIKHDEQWITKRDTSLLIGGKSVIWDSGIAAKWMRNVRLMICLSILGLFYNQFIFFNHWISGFILPWKLIPLIW